VNAIAAEFQAFYCTRACRSFRICLSDAIRDVAIHGMAGPCNPTKGEPTPQQLDEVMKWVQGMDTAGELCFATLNPKMF
jgi:hypothetical protein